MEITIRKFREYHASEQPNDIAHLLYVYRPTDKESSKALADPDITVLDMIKFCKSIRQEITWEQIKNAKPGRKWKLTGGVGPILEIELKIVYAKGRTVVGIARREEQSDEWENGKKRRVKNRLLCWQFSPIICPVLVSLVVDCECLLLR